MERDPFDFGSRNPENKLGFFEKEKDNPEELDTEEKAFKWFEKEKKSEKESDKPSKEKEEEPKSKPSKELPPSDSKEFKELPKQQQKQVLAKEYVQTRTVELEEELANIEPDTPEAAEIIADLELIAALDEKLDNPELEVVDAVELAYQQIMERLDEILADEREISEENEENIEDETDDIVHETPPFITLPKPQRPSPQPSPTPAPSTGRSPSARPNNSAASSPVSQRPAQPTPATATEAPARKPSSIESVRKRRAGKLAVSEALSQMLGRRYEATESTPTPETATPQSSDIPERVINPIKRSIAEKERQVRRLVTKQVVEAPFIERTPISQNELTSSYESYSRPSGVHLEPVRVDMPELRNRPTEQQPKQLDKETVRNLQQSSTPELLKLANNVTVEGTTLRRLFETNQIDRAGLVKVLKEALRGGDIKGALAKSKLGKEAQRGRAIEMRHDDPMLISDSSNQSAQQSAAEARTQQLLTALKSVKQQTGGSLPSEEQGASITPNEIALQKAKEAKQRLAISVTAAVVVTTAGILTLVLFLL